MWITKLTTDFEQADNNCNEHIYLNYFIGEGVGSINILWVWFALQSNKKS